ncbi:class I SAM-dependent methyltransferase [Schaalia sp. lx-260]|uniref:class I SAM-dependent methyltransferase n=1 Tax=Schaalia sp. lx-260 TaxID=2899082 RepID=UPI003FA7616C
MSQGTSPVKRADLDKAPHEIASMFDHVSARYDVTNAVLTGGMSYIWLAALARAVAPCPSDRILDVAAGTGTSSQVLARSGAHVVACDLSEGMIEVGRRRHPSLEFVHGDAMELPFDDDSFDAVTISYGLRNIPHPDRALGEMYRVVRPGGRLVVSEFSTPTHPLFRRLYDLHLDYVMPRVASLVSSDDVAYDYLVESIRSWPDQKTVAHMIKSVGWLNVHYRNLTGGIVALHRAQK